MILKDKILSMLIFLPIMSAIFILFFRNSKYRIVQFIALLSSIYTTILCVSIYSSYNGNTPNMQFQEHANWIPYFGVCYDLGIDGISMPFIMITCFSSVVGVLATISFMKADSAECLALTLVTQGIMTGALASLDSVLFYIFWEGMLIPLYLNILMFGRENRSYASRKFFLYSFLSSLPMVIAILYLGQKSGCFYIPSLYCLNLNSSEQRFLFISFAIGFMVKAPIFPLHTWLPETLKESPLGGYAALYIVMVKIGIYGFLRFNIPLTPDACYHYSNVVILLSIISVVYIGVIAISQECMKKFLAYSSISHVGLAMLGCFSVYYKNKYYGLQTAYTSIEGSMMQSLCHSFGSGGMFLAFSSVFRKFGSETIGNISGIANTMPILSFFYMLYSLSSIGLPGTSGFSGEFMVIASILRSNPKSTILAATTIIIGATYTLSLYKKSFFGEFKSVYTRQKQNKVSDVSDIERLTFFLLAIPLIIFGLFPKPILNVMHSSIASVVAITLSSKFNPGDL